MLVFTLLNKTMAKPNLLLQEISLIVIWKRWILIKESSFFGEHFKWQCFVCSIALMKSILNYLLKIWGLLHFSNVIHIHKYVLSTMGVSKESISKFLIGNRFHVK